MSVKNKACVAGIGDTEILKATDKVPIQFYHEAAKAAIEDAGLEKDDIDGLLYANSWYNPMLTPLLAQYLGLKNLKYMNMVEQEGASSAGMIMEAASLVSSGIVDYVLCISADVGRIPGQDALPFIEQPGPPRLGEYYVPYGQGLGANASYAMMASRHMYEYGTKEEHLAKIASDQRTNASMVEEGRALFRKPMKVEDVMNYPYIAWPLKLVECVYPCAGGVGFIVTSPEKAKKLTDAQGPAVNILGVGNAFGAESVEEHPMLRNGLVSPVKPAADRAYKMAGISPKEVDVCGTYDCYTITVLVHLEDLGFCKKGEGGKFVMEHDLTYKGDCPWNTSGGQLSSGQPGAAGGALNVLEVIRQLQGRAGRRQVKNAEIGVATGCGGNFSSKVVLAMQRSA